MARQTLAWLAALFVALELITLSAIVVGVMLPMARRSADDLAGLMLLSAQVWTELPPSTRPVFEQELRRAHGLLLRPSQAPPPEAELLHGAYIGFLELALEQRTGRPPALLRTSNADGEVWLWTTLPTGGAEVTVGFEGSRMSTHPWSVVALVLLAGTGLAVFGAWWLARRITQPIAELDRATRAMAAGETPQHVPERGPREIASLAARFNQMATQVHELLDARTTLFAGLSHDLRTPLARMRLALEMMALKPDPQWTTRIEQDIETMNALIGQLLELARGMDHAPKTRIECGAWLADRARQHAGLADAAHSTLRVACDAPVHLSVDTQALGRVVDNLVGNALRYAPGAIDLVVEQEAGHARIGVLDRGPGIPEAQRAAVWRPFHRLEPSRSASTGGYGLGLAIVRQLAQAHGWSVTLRAREGGGLAVWLMLPCVGETSSARQ